MLINTLGDKRPNSKIFEHFIRKIYSDYIIYAVWLPYVSKTNFCELLLVQITHSFIRFSAFLLIYHTYEWFWCTSRRWITILTLCVLGWWGDSSIINRSSVPEQSTREDDRHRSWSYRSRTGKMTILYKSDIERPMIYIYATSTPSPMLHTKSYEFVL